MTNVLDLCDKIAERVKNETGGTNENKEIIAYGLFAILQIFFTIILTFFIGYVFGVELEALIVTISIVILRRSSGGAHANTPNKCVLISVIIGIFLGKTCVLLTSTPKIAAGISIAIYLTSLIACIKYAPQDNQNKKIKSKEKRNRLKRNSIATVVLYFIFSVILQIISYKSKDLNLNSYIYSIFMGTAWQSFSITPYGINVLKKIS